MNPLSKYISTTTQSTGTEESRRSKRGGCKYPFPQRLFDLLQDIDVRKPEQSSILSWHPNGKYFQVHNRNAFERVIQKKYFNQSKYASFRRQLNLWGFERINPYHTTPTAEEDEQDFSSCYFHPLFQRHDRRLCCTMARVVGKDGSRLRSVSQDGSTEDDNTYHNKKENQVEEDIQESSTPFAVCSSSLPPSFLLVDNLDPIAAQNISMSTAPSSLVAPQDTGDNEVMVKGEEMLVRSEEHQLLQRQDFHSDEDMTEEQQQQQQQDKQQDKQVEEITSQYSTTSHHDHVSHVVTASSSSSRIDDYQFQLLINFLSANDDHIYKYLFEE